MIVSVPLCKEDHLFLSGKIDGDEFLCSLYNRDMACELKNYSPTFSSIAEAQKALEIVKNLPFDDLKKRLFEMAELTRSFHHFKMIRFQVSEQDDYPDLKNVPFLLSRKANLRRYYAGK